ncbi:hypothetical protein [Streptomyces spectabilis]|uniref:Uncharacterized protein n=1 Tax=Streptomyces spectabilis TaxID=68270 RepID=A0A7W8EY43_STRST|nr:hypothetical protein [Streptomyces spectabilis]MBB5109737.1 hypothetical protein [Streptomyces spectabilis]GGV55275.1 hypothetical protein GCM10010245_87480 [Streptomyces spectabilis]
MVHRQQGNGQVGGEYSSPGDPGNPMPEEAVLPEDLEEDEEPPEEEPPQEPGSGG